MSETTLILITGYSIAVFGFVSSIISLWIIYKIKILHNSFGFISAAQSFIDGLMLFFNVFVAFTIISIDPDLENSFPIIIVGFIIAFCNSAVTYLQLLKAINRLYAIISPTNYRNIFTIKKTILYLMIVCILNLIQVFLYLFSSCNFIFASKSFSWFYNSSTNCYQKIGYFYATWSVILNLAIILFLDGITLFYLRVFRKRLMQHNKKMMTAEIRFFFQSLLTSIFYIIMLFSPRILSSYATAPFVSFLIYNANILLFHSTNEFFFIIFTIFISKSSKIVSNVAVISPKLNS